MGIIASPNQANSCSIVFCKKRAIRRGYCHRHIYRISRYRYPFTRRELFALRHPPKDGIAFIPLTKGKIAIVDEDMHEYLSQWSWGANFGGYAVRIEKKNGLKRYVFMHREIAKTPINLFVDHLNHNTSDNRRVNLRNVTASVNQQNQLSRPKTCRFKGVCKPRRTSRWRASIGYRRTTIYLGTFDSEINAAIAYDKKAKELYGKEAILNFPHA